MNLLKYLAALGAQVPSGFQRSSTPIELRVLKMTNVGWRMRDL